MSTVGSSGVGWKVNGLIEHIVRKRFYGSKIFRNKLLKTSSIKIQGYATHSWNLCAVSQRIKKSVGRTVWQNWYLLQLSRQPANPTQSHNLAIDIRYFHGPSYGLRKFIWLTESPRIHKRPTWFQAAFGLSGTFAIIGLENTPRTIVRTRIP